jgi:hypothetical protein
MKKYGVWAALIAALLLAGTACGKKEGPASASAPAGGPSARPAPEPGPAEALGQKIAAAYFTTLERVADMLKDRRPAEDLKPMLLGLKTGTIDIMIGLGREREALSSKDRAVVDRILANRITLLQTDLLKRFREGQANYRENAELFKLIASFTDVARYADFDLLKQQLPEEAARLGIR